MNRLVAYALPLAVACLLPGVLAGQAESEVGPLARVLAAEDARDFDAPLFRRVLADPDSFVRREAALGLGRPRVSDGIPLLTPLLLDPDSLVQTTAAFALGLIGDSTAAAPLLARTRDPAPLATSTALEIETALARLGGPDAAEFLRAVLEGVKWRDRGDSLYVVQRAALEAWRLAAHAPVSSLLGLLQHPNDEVRFGAVYSLGRLKARAAAPRLVETTADRAPQVRAAAARTLTRAFSDSSGITSEAAGDVLARLTQDADAGVRIQAIRALGSYADPRLVARVLPLLDDPAPNVQVQAAMTLGELGGMEAVPALVRVLSGTKGSFARRREALVSLSRLDTAAFRGQAVTWTASPDWRERAAAAEGWANANPPAVAPFLKDQDPRVIAAALQAWGGSRDGASPEHLAACRQLARHRDAAVRSVAADGLTRAANPADLPLLIQLVRASARDSFPEARLSALNGLVALTRNAPDRAAAEAGVLAQVPVPEDYVTRRWAEENWPAAAARWGAPYPVVTGRSMEEYRDLVRQFVVGTDSTRYPRVRMDIADLGTVEIELFGPEAPLTVASFLRLVSRRYFDGQRFHRVVPDFVVQTGDPRGDGWGGPGGAIRDEINRRRYGAYFVGMALSGPDTGGSQWFITLSPQPHLDGVYTIFGRVTDGVPLLLRVTQGDQIRSLRR